MKSQILLTLSHGAVAAAAIGATVASGSFTAAPAWVIVAGASTIVAIGAAMFLSAKIRQGTKQIHAMVVRHESAAGDCGIEELDQLVKQLSDVAQRFETVEANDRRHSREIKAILSRLSRREIGDEPDINLLKNVLGGIGRSLSTLMDQVEQDVLKIGRCTQEITASSGNHHDAAAKAETAVQSLGQSLLTVTQRAAEINQRIETTQNAISDTIGLTSKLSEGVSKIRSCSETSKRKLQALCDPTRQISNLVSNIGDVAARTEMLALNASIESIRAGEHGRSFAVVADEIRKLAEQTNASANEIGVLAESLESQTNDSIAVLEKENHAVDQESQLILTVESSLRGLSQLAQQSISEVSALTGEHANQQRVVETVLGGIESLCGVGQADRAQADHAAWAVKSLAKVAIDLDSTIHRIHTCNDPSAPADPIVDPQLVAIASQVEDPSRAHQRTAPQSALAQGFTATQGSTATQGASA